MTDATLPPDDDNKLIAERREKLAAIRGQGVAFPNDFKPKNHAADLQQKYGDVLASKTPDVQEANLGEKGLWYRAVVGPPGSREAASAVCAQLKTAGHSACWVTAY